MAKGGLVTVNGYPAISATFWMPRVGPWHADLKLDSIDWNPSGLVSISVLDGKRTLVGTVKRGGNHLQTSYARVVGGANGLGLTVTPKHYNGVTVKIVLADLLRTAGETLSSTVSASLLAVQLPAWTVLGRTVGRELADLIDACPAGTAWRFLDDGTLWLGAETWPSIDTYVGDYQELSHFPWQNKQEIGLVAPMLRAGATLGDMRIEACEQSVTGDSVRAVIWGADATG